MQEVHLRAQQQHGSVVPADAVSVEDPDSGAVGDAVMERRVVVVGLQHEVSGATEGLSKRNADVGGKGLTGVAHSLCQVKI